MLHDKGTEAQDTPWKGLDDRSGRPVLPAQAGNSAELGGVGGDHCQPAP
jgi:hypothetical protein